MSYVLLKAPPFMYRLRNYFSMASCVEGDNLVSSSTAILNKLNVNDLVKQRRRNLSNSQLDSDDQWLI